jgi:hypothetical protein
MMRALFCLTILVVCDSAQSQTRFAQEVAKQLARDPRAKEYYVRSDAYRYAVNFRAQRALDSIQGDAEFDRDDGALSFDSTSKDVSNDKFDQEETTIAINRQNHNLVIAGSNDQNSGRLQMPVYRTSDGGRSWYTYRLPALPDDRFATGDPMIAAGNDGRFYYAFLTAPKYSISPIQLVVAVSFDGINWTNMQPVDTSDAKAEHTLQDKPSIVVDNSTSSPYYGRVYAVWTETTDITPDAGLRLVFSDDRGRSWSAHKILTTDINDLFSQVGTGRNGEIVVSYSSYNDSLHKLLVSTDGGKTFESRLIAKHNPFPFNGHENYSLKGASGPRAYPYCTTAMDLSTNRLHNVYGTWNRWGDSVHAAELLYVYSDDLGKTWSEAVPVFGDSSRGVSQQRDRFFPWLTFDASTAKTSLLYYSSEADSANLWTAPYCSVLGADQFEHPRALVPSSFNPLAISSQFIGDYIGCDAYEDRFAAAWAQTRKGATDCDVFATVLITDSSKLSIPLPTVLTQDRVTLLPPFPNPASQQFSLSFAISTASQCTIDLVREDGSSKTLLSDFFGKGSYIREFTIGDIPSGAYTVRLATIKGSAETGLLVRK